MQQAHFHTASDNNVNIRMHIVEMSLQTYIRIYTIFWVEILFIDVLSRPTNTKPNTGIVLWRFISVSLIVIMMGKVSECWESLQCILTQSFIFKHYISRVYMAAFCF